MSATDPGDWAGRRAEGHVILRVIRGRGSRADVGSLRAALDAELGPAAAERRGPERFHFGARNVPIVGTAPDGELEAVIVSHWRSAEAAARSRICSYNVTRSGSSTSSRLPTNTTSRIGARCENSGINSSDGGIRRSSRVSRGRVTTTSSRLVPRRSSATQARSRRLLVHPTCKAVGASVPSTSRTPRAASACLISASMGIDAARSVSAVVTIVSVT